MDVFSRQIELQNQQNILACIEQMESVSRADVARHLGLSRTTLSCAVTRLMELDLVRECGLQRGARDRGRPGIPLALTQDVWYAAGAAFYDQHLLFALLDLTGSVVEQFALPVPDGSPEAFLKILTEGFGRIIAACPGRLLPMLGVGTPGTVNNGLIRIASDMFWTNVPVADHLQKELGLPSIVVNRHWACCIGEHHVGAGKGVRSMIYVGLSTGIAASIILDGRLFTGAHHSAGEIGHTVVNRNGPRCTCGRRGCLHAYSSERALLQHVRDHYAGNPFPMMNGDPLFSALARKKDVTIDDFCQAAAAGHPFAVQEMNNAALYAGLSIGNLISMFNPQRVILGGSFIEHGGKALADMIISSVREHASKDTPVAVEILPWSLGRYSGPLGAAMMVLDDKLNLALQWTAAHR